MKLWEQLDGWHSPSQKVTHKQVAELFIQGLNQKEIAQELCISTRAVKDHFQKMFALAGIEKRNGDIIQRVVLLRMLWEERNEYVWKNKIDSQRSESSTVSSRRLDELSYSKENRYNRIHG